MVRGRYPLPATEGDRVRWVRQPGISLGAEPDRGEGVFTRCWLGIEEVWTVTRDDGSLVHLYPCFGDTMEPTSVLDE